MKNASERGQITMLPRSRFSWILLLVGTLLLGSAWIVYSREGAETAVVAAEEAPAVGYKAPDFSLEMLDGDAFALSAQEGMPVVLNFWATWCPPCRAEIPHFQSASVKYNGQVVIAGVDDGESVNTVAPFVREMGMTYPVPLDSDRVVSRRYRVNSLPATFFIDGDGVIQYIHIGIISQAVLEAEIEALIQSS